MKKTISLVIICLLAIMSLTVCGSTSTSELDELRQQVKALETRVSKLENSERIIEDSEEVSTSTGETTSNSTEITESNANSNQQIQEYLDNQLNSNNPDNWLEIAQCDFATEEHLLAVAKKCAKLKYYNSNILDESMQFEILNALSENSATTDTVMAELVSSRYPGVWKAVAWSSKSGEKALLAVAKKCAKLKCYNSDILDESMQIEIANALSENSATTPTVMAELVVSKYPSVVSIGHGWIEP